MIKKALDIALTVIVLSVSVVVGVTAWRLNTSMTYRPEVRDYKEGQKIDFVAADQTIRLVLGISPTCSWCKKDIPLYQRIGKSKRVQDGSVNLVVMTPPEMKELSAQWLKDSEIPGTMAAPPSGQKYPFAATPTLILAKGNKIVWTHRGGITKEAEGTLFAKLDH